MVTKITSILPDSVCPSDGENIEKIHSGITRGWRHLPPSVQKVVEWVGIEFTHPPFQKCVEVKIKIKSKETNTELSVSFYIDNFFKPELIENVSSEFRKTVLEGIEKIVKDLQEQTKTFQQLLL